MIDETKELLEEYENLCKNRDWYFYYSDDHSVWSRGQANLDRCIYIVNYLKQLGLKDKTVEIYNKYAPTKATVQ
jgi:hypothetical protein